MKTSLKEMGKPSDNILSYASMLYPVLLKTHYILCLEIYIYIYIFGAGTNLCYLPNSETGSGQLFK